MTIIISPVPLPPFGGQAYNHITPFTYRDGLTYVEVLESLRAYIRDILVPLVDEGFDNTEDYVNNAVGELTQFVNDTVQLIIDDSIQLQDPVLTGILADIDSQSRAYLDTIFANKATQEAVETGRLSPTQLSNTFANKSTQETVETGRLSTTQLNNAFANKATQGTVETGRLSPTQLNSTILATSGKLNVASAVTLGDSRTMLNGNFRKEAALGTSVNKSDTGYLTHALLELRQRFQVLANGGVGGDTVAQMLARTDALLALNPGWLIGFGCVNSISDGVSAASIIADFTTIFDKATAKGIKIVWGTDWYTPTHDAAKRAEMDKVNDWLRSLVGSRPDFYLVEYAAPMSNPVNGFPLITLAPDYVHQGPDGAVLMGRELAKVMNTLIPPSDRLTSSNVDSTNLLTNGMFEGDEGAGRATGWGGGSGPGATTYSKVPRTDGYPGTWQQCAVVDATPTRSLRQDVSTGFAPGDVVFGELEFETDSAGWAATQFFLLVQMVGATGNPYLSTDLAHDITGPDFTERPVDGILRTPPITVPPGTTTIRFTPTLVGSGTFRVARARLTKMG